MRNYSIFVLFEYDHCQRRDNVSTILSVFFDYIYIYEKKRRIELRHVRSACTKACRKAKQIREIVWSWITLQKQIVVSYTKIAERKLDKWLFLIFTGGEQFYSWPYPVISLYTPMIKMIISWNLSILSTFLTFNSLRRTRKSTKIPFFSLSLSSTYLHIYIYIYTRYDWKLLHHKKTKVLLYYP